MKFEIQENDLANNNHFNFYLKSNYDLLSISYKDDKVLITSNVSETKKNEIIAFYDGLDGDFTSDTEYMESFLIEKYKVSAEKGREYIFLVTAKINIMVQLGHITLVEAEEYGVGVSTTLNELERGYWHSSFNSAFAYAPIASMVVLHNEVTSYIKNYVNTIYPDNFHIE